MGGPKVTVDVSGLIPPDDEGEFAFEVHDYIVQAVDRIAASASVISRRRSRTSSST